MRTEDLDKIVIGETKVAYDGERDWLVIGKTSRTVYPYGDFMVFLEREDSEGNLLSRSVILDNVEIVVPLEEKIESLLKDLIDKETYGRCPKYETDCGFSCTICRIKSFTKQIMEEIE
jgi:hypothetical protein